MKKITMSIVPAPLCQKNRLSSLLTKVFRLFTLIAILTANKGLGQETKLAGGLSIGQLVPDVTIANIHNYKSSTAKISDFKGKLVILDFWATWCAPCISMIPRLDSLRTELPNQLEIFSVTNQKDAEVLPFLSKLEKQLGKKISIPVVPGDRTLAAMFPHIYLPHYVWITVDQQGKGMVSAITSLNEVTLANVQKVLAKERTAFAVKADGEMVKYNPYTPLFDVNSIGGQSEVLLQSVLTGYKEGLNGGHFNNTRVDSIAGVRRITCRNQGIVKLYQTAFGYKGTIGWNRTVLEVADSSKLEPPKTANRNYLQWLKDGNGYCYELIVPAALARNALPIMQDDLSKSFPQFSAKLEKRQMECLVLELTGTGSELKTSGGKSSAKIIATGARFSNYRYALAVLADQLSSVYMQQLPTPVIDETGFTGAADIEINAPLHKPEEVNRELNRYGVKLSRQMRIQDVLVIRDK